MRTDSPVPGFADALLAGQRATLIRRRHEPGHGTDLAAIRKMAPGEELHHKQPGTRFAEPAEFEQLRTIAAQIAWIWVRYQRESELTQWYLTRFAHAGPRARKVGIVGVARRLMIDLWRYLDTGMVPAGARLRPAKRTARAGATRAA